MDRSTTIQETDRLIIRRLSMADAEFILRLVNEPSWLNFIGDKGVRTIADAQGYLVNGPLEMYDCLGFGLYAVESKEEGQAIGICGLIKRDFLEDADVGFAFFPEYWGQGYAYESAAAVMDHGKKVLGLKRILAITTSDNHRSEKLLKKLGFRYERMTRHPGEEKEVRLFAIEF